MYKHLLYFGLAVTMLIAGINILAAKISEASSIDNSLLNIVKDGNQPISNTDKLLTNLDDGEVGSDSKDISDVNPNNDSIENPLNSANKPLDDSDTNNQLSEYTDKNESESVDTTEANHSSEDLQDDPSKSLEDSDTEVNTTDNKDIDEQESQEAIDSTPDNANEPSKDGLSFLLTIFRRGFDHQPPEEQYIALQNIAKAKISGMSILIGLGNLLGKTIKVRRWHWDATTSKWMEDKNQPNANTINTVFGLLGFFDVKDYSLGKLAVGTYCYQFSFSDGVWPINNKTFYSDLSKVTVTPKPKPAKSVDIDMPSIIYSDVNYKAKAIIDPNDSTDDILWKSNDEQKDKFTFNPNTGRKIDIRAGDGKFDEGSKQYIPDSYYVNEVNTNPYVDGIPATVDISAEDEEETVHATGNKTVDVGGLPAYNKAADMEGSWQVGGLDSLVTATGSANSWHYEWSFTDSKGNKLTLNDNAGVQNTSGNIDDLTKLNTEQPLTFTKGSAFMKEAEKATSLNSSYQAQLKLTTSIDEEDGEKASHEITVISNKAELQAMPAVGKLTLDKVPNFNFGNIKAKDVYSGTDMANNIKTEDSLQVTDTRATSEWKLSAKMSKFQSKSGANLNKSAISLSSSGINNVILNDDNVETVILASEESFSSNVSGNLLLSANPSILLSSGEYFSSEITWNLITSQPAF